MRRTALSLVAIGLLLLSTFVQAGEEPGAADLVQGMRHELALVYQTVDEQGGAMKVSAMKLGVFALSVKKASAALDDLESGIAYRNETYWNALHRSGGAIYEVAAGWGCLGAKSEVVDGALKRLAYAWEAFRANYGKEALRVRQGGEVTAQERAEVERLREHNARLAGELRGLQARAQADQAGQAVLPAITFMLGLLAAPRWSGPITIESWGWSYGQIEVMEGYWNWSYGYSISSGAAYGVYFDHSHFYFGWYEESYWRFDHGFEVGHGEWGFIEGRLDRDVAFDGSVTKEDYDKFESDLKDLPGRIDERTLVADNDADNDGQPNAQDEDDDGDGTPDLRDEDDDGNGVADKDEPDFDHDGIVDRWDADDDNDGSIDPLDRDDNNDGMDDPVGPEGKDDWGDWGDERHDDGDGPDNGDWGDDRDDHGGGHDDGGNWGDDGDE